MQSSEASAAANAQVMAPQHSGAPQPSIPELSQPIPATAPTNDDNDDDSADEPWVEKARSTINQYRTDPYMQSRALSRLKAEYMQARHNKALKVED
jgi:hypothetical protein